MNILLNFFLASITTLAIVHAVSLEFFLYWKYEWLDIPMHILGGASVALGFSVLPFFRITLPLRYTTFLTYVCVVLFVGLTWEVFELASGIALVDEYFIGDTIIDLCMDILGGTFGYGIVKNIKTL